MEVDESQANVSGDKRDRVGGSTGQRRKRPNILICGTPGTGKTTLAQSLMTRLSSQSEDDVGASASNGAAASFLHLAVGEIADKEKCFEEFDETRNCHVLDEERLLDAMEDEMNNVCGGRLCDYHGCDLFPERWFDAVFVLRTDNTTLFDRLTARGYAQAKVRENVECEIFGTLMEEACEAYREAIVFEFQSTTVGDMERNTEQILDWIQQWTHGAVECDP